MLPERTSSAFCLEGNAGCGKTTSGKNLAISLGGMFLPEYTETFTDAQRQSLNAAYMDEGEVNEAPLWRSAECHRIARVLAEPQKTPVLDVSILTVVGFALARRAFGSGGNVDSIVSSYLRMLTDDRIVLPGRIILLHAAESERQKRIAIRGACHPFLAREDVSVFLDKVRRDFVTNYLPDEASAILDTTHLSSSIASERVLTLSSRLRVDPRSCCFLTEAS